MNKTGLKGSKAACLEVWELLRPHLDSVAGNTVCAADQTPYLAVRDEEAGVGLSIPESWSLSRPSLSGCYEMPV